MLVHSNNTPVELLAVCMCVSFAPLSRDMIGCLSRHFHDVMWCHGGLHLMHARRIIHLNDPSNILLSSFLTAVDEAPGASF